MGLPKKTASEQRSNSDDGCICRKIFHSVWESEKGWSQEFTFAWEGQVVSKEEQLEPVGWGGGASLLWTY